MQEIIVLTFCDWPGCKDTHHAQYEGGQEVTQVDYWVYVAGRGRKTNKIRVELCDEHLALIKGQYEALKKFAKETDDE